MATDDQQILVTGTAATPASHTIPGNGQIQPKAIFATYDGTSAVGTYKPALKIISDGGELVGIYPTDTSIAAGGSANVSWFPGVGGSPSGVGPSSPGLMAVSVEVQGAQAITVGPNDQIVVWDATQFDTGTPTPFWSNANPTRLTAPVDGYYLSLGNLEFDVITVQTNLGCYLFKNGATGFAYEYEFNTDTILSSSGPGSASYNLQGGTHGVIGLAAGDYLEMAAFIQPSAGVPATVNLLDLRPAQNHYTKWALVCLATT